VQLAVSRSEEHGEDARILAVCTGWIGFVMMCSSRKQWCCYGLLDGDGVEERQLIVEETLEVGSSVARVALQHGVNANQVFKWRRLHEAGRLGTRAVRELQLLPVRMAQAIQNLGMASITLSAISCHLATSSTSGPKIASYISPTFSRWTSRSPSRMESSPS
jgi:transposase-like protein